MMPATAAHRLRRYLHLETDAELRARLTQHPRFAAFLWQLTNGANLDLVAEAMGMPRRLVECES